MPTTYSIKTYNEAIQFPTFEQRFDYLKLPGSVGVETFGTYGRRWMNQHFYSSREWKDIKQFVILRDNCCDLAIPEYELINCKIYVHHLNPITDEDILNRTQYLMDPKYLICTSFETHNAIHYGDINVSRKAKDPIERTPFDTCPWIHV